MHTYFSFISNHNNYVRMYNNFQRVFSLLLLVVVLLCYNKALQMTKMDNCMRKKNINYKYYEMTSYKTLS